MDQTVIPLTLNYNMSLNNFALWLAFLPEVFPQYQ